MTTEEPTQIGDRLKSTPVFSQLLSWSKGVTTSLGYEELDLEAFALGAYLAHKNGHLDDAPVLNEHVAAHGRHFDTFIRTRRVNLNEVNPSSETLRATRDFDLAAARSEFDAENPTLALLNRALTEIVAEAKLERVAIHEAGHAVISLALRPEIRIERASISPSGDKAGVVMFDVTSPHYSSAHARCLEDVKEDLCVSLAGQVATVKAFGTDAANVGVGMDMRQATITAFEAVALVGLDPDFGPIHLATIAELMEKYVGAPTQGGYLFDEAQRRTQALLKSAFEGTQKLVDEHWDAIQRVAQLLLENEMVDENAILAAVKG